MLVTTYSCKVVFQSVESLQLYTILWSYQISQAIVSRVGPGWYLGVFRISLSHILQKIILMRNSVLIYWLF